MTNLADLGVDQHRRDQWGRMMVVPPGRERPTGYTRVTTVAKALDDGGGLAPWKATMVMLGAMARPGLRARWETLVAATNGDPWYASKQSKAAAKALVEDCATVGGASDRAEQGTGLHAITAMVDQGLDVRNLSPQTEADVTAYVNAMIGAGICISKVHGSPAVEVTVVLDEWQVAGTFDRIVELPGFAKPVVADLKTGDLTYSWQSIAVQLAAYAHANDVYEQGADPNGSTDVRAPMPDVDQDHALIVNLRPGSAQVTFHVVDIAAGWDAFQLSMQARRWRSRRDLALPLPALDQRVNPLRLVADDGVVIGAGRDDASASAPIADEGIERLQLRNWLQGRITVIGQHVTAREAFVIRWRALGVPTLRQSIRHTDEQLAAIEALCDDIEARHSIPFGPSKPGTAQVPTDSWVHRLTGVFPGSTITDTDEET